MRVNHFFFSKVKESPLRKLLLALSESDLKILPIHGAVFYANESDSYQAPRNMKYSFLFIVIFFLCSCNSAPAKKEDATVLLAAEKTSDTYKYDVGKPEKKWTLPSDLLEISGIAWIDNSHLLAIEDIRPDLYLLRLDNSVVVEKKIPFHKTSKQKFDIEDVTVVGNTAYALYSHGKIFKVDNWRDKPAVKEISTFLTKDNNTEGICFDPASNTLLVSCKNASDVEDEKKSTRAVYKFDVKGDSLEPTPYILIHKKDISKMGGEKLDFYPSAIAVHPKTNDIYILSTKGTKALAQYTHAGELKAVQLLDANLLPQPEGICFSPEGVMYISTEAKHGSPAAIYQFNSK